MFDTGISVDLITAGVPVIEFADAGGPFAKSESQTEADASPAGSRYQHSGLVLPADSIAEFRAAVLNSLTTPSDVAVELQGRLRDEFADPEVGLRRTLVLREKGLRATRSRGTDAW